MTAAFVLKSPSFFWCPEFRVEWKDALPSTQAFLLSKARSLPSGSVVVADVQASGIGRKGRKWASASPKGLWMSLLFKRQFDACRAFLIPFWTALSLSSAVRSFGVEGVSPVWPNDLYLDGKKLAGVLVDTKTQASELKMAVVGVGLNLNQALEDFPEDLRPVATSLWLATDRRFSKQAFIQAFLHELVSLWGFIEQEGDGAFLEAYWQAACGQTSKFVFVVSGQRARAIGLEQSGGLCLEMEDGSVLVARDVGDIVKTTPERQDASHS
jgi:BirA family biotin operon repressor/biotin-[acetyl-CoA-carboxylase] ligase